ncbi:Hypothetical predicted protein [Mytilus galloprovincialis]|uniref:Uncharacterized protein n=1 Tax=Mytilus galloprovincialis TaxID=29158 RepID=A0A8B6FQ97_MYTGA|nr:Hypothetical predicted protein [Mytilus galloprovincialis]
MSRKKSRLEKQRSTRRRRKLTDKKKGLEKSHIILKRTHTVEKEREIGSTPKIKTLHPSSRSTPTRSPFL